MSDNNERPRDARTSGGMAQEVLAPMQGKTSPQDHRQFVRTQTPGVYKRGSRYVVVYRANGRQIKEVAPNYETARKIKAARTADVQRGEFHEESRVTFRSYAEEWIDRYSGRGRGFRESTRDNYRGDLERYAVPYFGERKRLSAITPRDLANFIAWLTDEAKQGRHRAELARQREKDPEKARKIKEKPVRLSDSTIANIFNPVRACLATAVDEDLIRRSPAVNVRLPKRPRVADDDEPEQARAFTREQLRAFLALVHPRHRLMFEFLSVSGLRVSELVALQWQHLKLDGSKPHVRIRRQLYRGRLGPPKSKHGRRNVPLDASMVNKLREHRRGAEWGGNEDLVFPNEVGKPVNVENLRRRHLRAVVEEIDTPWASFHTFRHTAASLLFERGASVVLVQRWLGHHSAAFTLDTYVHWLDQESLGDPLVLADELPEGGNKRGTRATESQQTREAVKTPDLAL
jgi:integrase